MAKYSHRIQADRRTVTSRGMYIYGNTVRQAEVMPQRQEEPRKEHKKKKLDRQILKNRRKAMRMNPAYVMFLSIAAVAALVVCVWYLQVRAELTSRTEHITELQHRIALVAVFGLKEEYGYKELEDALIKSYTSIGVKLNHQKAVPLITMLRNKRMIVQENGRKYTFMPDFHY